MGGTYFDVGLGEVMGGIYRVIGLGVVEDAKYLVEETGGK